MSRASSYSRPAVSLVVIALLTLGAIMPGCSQAPPPQPGEPAGPEAEASPKPAEPLPEPEQPSALSQPDQPAPLPDLDELAALAAGAPVSAYAPAEDLVGEVAAYLKGLETCVASEEDYKDYAEKIARDANTLVLITLALGMHDEDNQYKPSAGGLVKAAQELAAATDFASASRSVAALKQAAQSQSAPAAELKWEKAASLPETMKKVPLVHTSLKKYIRRIETRSQPARGEAAVLAVIAQGSMANAGDTKRPDEVEKWRRYCIQMRNAAASVGAAIRAKHEGALTATMTRLQQSCDACHEVFAPEQLQAAQAE
jgi:hypothetical protein